MGLGGVKRKLARTTRDLRAAFGLAAPRPQPHRFASLPGESLPRTSHDRRLAALEGELRRLMSGWDQHIPQILDTVSNALSEARAAQRVHDRIDELRHDMDRLTARLDLNLLDLKSQVLEARRSAGTKDVRIISMAGVANAVSGELKLHFMGDDAPRPGFVNISDRLSAGVDVVAGPAAILPFGEGLVRDIEVSCGFDPEGDAGAQVARWFLLLAPGGRLRMERFDLASAIEAVAAGRADPVALAAVARDGLIRVSPPGPSLETWAELLREAGFDKVRAEAWKGRGGEVLTAERPGSTQI